MICLQNNTFAKKRNLHCNLVAMKLKGTANGASCPCMMPKRNKIKSAIP